MLIRKTIFQPFVRSARLYSASTDPIKSTLLIQKTSYQTDEWTNITPRFESFVGANLYQKRNHPLKLTLEGVDSFFKKWFVENVDSNIELPLCKNMQPIVPNLSSTKEAKTFYVSRDLMLRTNAIQHEIKYLKSGIDHFMMVVDLYRRCQMDSDHFPAFHRMNIIRTMYANDSQPESSSQQLNTALEEEQKAALVEFVRHLFGNDVKYRWTERNLASTDPSWIFEIWHFDNWHRISGCGAIRQEIFNKSDRPNRAGWEISIGLDRLAMILYNIFDIRLLWNADKSFLRQFEPKVIAEIPTVAKISTVQSTQQAKQNVNTERLQTESTPDNSQENTIKSSVLRKSSHEMRISFILPSQVELETFPINELCAFIKSNTNNAAQVVSIIAI